MQVERYNAELAQVMRAFGAFEEAEVMVGRVNVFRHTPHVRPLLPSHAMDATAGRMSCVGGPAERPRSRDTRRQHATATRSRVTRRQHAAQARSTSRAARVAQGREKGKGDQQERLNREIAALARSFRRRIFPPSCRPPATRGLLSDAAPDGDGDGVNDVPITSDTLLRASALYHASFEWALKLERRHNCSKAWSVGVLRSFPWRVAPTLLAAIKVSVKARDSRAES